MDLHDLHYRHELDRRLSRLYSAPTANEDDWVPFPKDAEAARALLGTVSQLTGHDVFARIASSALTAHVRYTDPKTMSSYPLCRDTALRKEFGESWEQADLGWAAIILEAARVQMGDAAFAPFLRCVVEAEQASSARTGVDARASV
ncbi:hypothetical protein ACFVYR_29015 [Streptomyces sp. NPDC058284]|uniref:hypothetical protein n=1 Tax=unclassified Streptomyces TaxID=2593676 RepID=UPI003659592A